MKLRRHNKPEIGLSNANPARGHKEMPRSTGHHGDNTLLKPTGIQSTTRSLPGPTTREHRKLITGLRRRLQYKLQFLLSRVLPIREQQVSLRGRQWNRAARAKGRDHFNNNYINSKQWFAVFRFFSSTLGIQQVSLVASLFPNVIPGVVAAVVIIVV